MGLYIGNSEKLKIIIGNNLASKMYVGTMHTENAKLLSHDNFTLKSSDGYYLTVKEE